jgi:hypothetical protein
VATLVAGLRDDSRIKMKRRNDRVERSTLLLALLCDILTALASAKKPNDVSLVEMLNGNPQSQKKEKTNDIIAYATGEDFERARAEILGKEAHDG